VSNVFPLIRQQCKTARLLVAGSRPGPNVRRLARAEISILPDLSDEELRGRYAAARVAVAPLQFGAGVKLKVVEALREGVPLVTTPVGAQGLPGLDGVASIAADPAGFADAVCRLLTDDLMWQQRCAGQLRYARARFSEQSMRHSFQAGLGLAWSAPHSMASAA
jgi:glycosyltransferase involved in cell wall biosynthesis